MKATRVKTIPLTVQVDPWAVAEEVAEWDRISEIVAFVCACVIDDDVANAVCEKLTKDWTLKG